MGFSRPELVEEAHRAGYSEVKERLITDWVEQGLLDEGQRIGRGKGGGRGARYEWSSRQRDLLLALLQQRKGLKGVKGLCQLPVSVWLYWGDEWIPLRQVRIALRTWWSAAGEFRSRRRAEQNARWIVDAYAGTEGSRQARKNLQAALADSLDRGEFDVEGITPLVQAVLNARSKTSRVWGPFQFSPKEMVDGLRAMSLAIDHYDDISDGYFYEVRARHRQTVLAYLREFQFRASDPTYGSWFQEPTFEMWVNRACHDLLLGLGLRLIADQESRILEPVALTDWHKPPPEMLRRIK